MTSAFTPGKNSASTKLARKGQARPQQSLAHVLIPGAGMLFSSGPVYFIIHGTWPIAQIGLGRSVQH